MMTTPIRLVALLAWFTIVAACGDGRLQRETAANALAEHPLLKTLTPIDVQAVSQGDSAAEAIARVSIDDNVLNFKFRRYDDGWRWEFAETKAGGWIAPDVVAQQLIEQRRQKKVAEWAAKFRDPYGTTIKAMNGYSENMPRRPDMGINVLSWQQMRGFWKDIPLMGRTREQVDEIAFKYLGSDRDAWSNEILVSFDDSQRTAMFVSVGPDGTNP